MAVSLREMKCLASHPDGDEIEKDAVSGLPTFVPLHLDGMRSKT
jgi:hypothetical protein